jgi:hypothetical protein
LKKLKTILYKGFEYENNELSSVRFLNVVKRWLKTKRNKLKAKFMGGQWDCLINIEPTHWEKLKVYWPKQERRRKV